MQTQKYNYWPLFMWLFPLSFFTYQFILRLWPGLMMDSIMEKFAVDASGFGFLAALYYYGYAGMQVPIAILSDRFSTRRVVWGYALLCGVSMFIFSHTQQWYLACFSRFLIGVGSAVGFLGTSKVISEWFPKSHYAKMTGFTFTVGLLGAIYGGKPVSLLIESYGAGSVATLLAIVSIAMGWGVYWGLRSPAHLTIEPEKRSSVFKLDDFKVLLSSPIIWLLAIANLLLVGALEGFADVWGVSYLVVAYGLSKSQAAELISFIFVGMLFGGPLLAVVSKKIGNYTVMALCGLGIMGTFIFLLANPFYNEALLATLFFCIGILCCYQVIVFAAGSDLVSPSLLGVTIAFLNCVNMFGGSFFHTTIGIAMDLFWTGGFTSEGIREYSLETYQMALKVIPLCALLGTFIIAGIGFQLRKRKIFQTLELA